MNNSPYCRLATCAVGSFGQALSRFAGRRKVGARTLGCLATALLVGGGPLSAADHGGDRAVLEQVEERLARKGIDGVEVVARDGELVLRGAIETLEERRRLLRHVDKVSGGRRVLDQTWFAALDDAAARQELDASLARSLRNVPYYGVFDWVEVDLDGSTARLSGVIDQPFKRDVLIRRLEQIPGLSAIDDQIRVLRLSTWDERVRRQVARAIYGNLTFFGRSFGLAPPIHIVVEKGRVTLEGVVSNDAERLLARSLAARAPQSVGPIVNNLRTTAEIAR